MNQLDPGQYVMTVVSTTISTSKTNERWSGVRIKLRDDGGSDGVASHNCTITNNGNVEGIGKDDDSGKLNYCKNQFGMYFGISLLRACFPTAYNWEDMSSIPGIIDDLNKGSESKVCGLKCRGTVAYQMKRDNKDEIEYDDNGNPRIEVKYINPLGDSPADRESMGRVQNLVGSIFKCVDGNGSSSSLPNKVDRDLSDIKKKIMGKVKSEGGHTHNDSAREVILKISNTVYPDRNTDSFGFSEWNNVYDELDNFDLLSGNHKGGLVDPDDEVPF